MNTTINGVEFRPFSCATLTMLDLLDSPFLQGGASIGSKDVILFAWLHAAPVPEVTRAVSAGTAMEHALQWSFTVPPGVFKIMTAEYIIDAFHQLEQMWEDETSGFRPFPSPSFSRPTWKKRASIIGLLLSVIGWRRRPSPVSGAEASPSN